jgi:hypothetical protein
MSHIFLSMSLPNLETLSLQLNQIGDEGMKSLSSAIASGSLRSLIILRLDGNKISDPGMIAFAEALKSPMGSLRSLTHLELGSNEISDPGMIAFSNAIRNGSLPALEQVVVQTGYENHPALVAACRPRGIRIG